MAEYTFWQLGLAVTGAFFLGLGKAGIKGLSVIVVTIFAIVFGSKYSTGVIMPLLIIGDVFAVIYYHRHTQWIFLKKLLPWMMAGVLIGVWIGKDLPEELFKKGMASIILISILLMVWMEKQKKSIIPQQVFFGAGMGITSGITTMIGNLAGAFSDLYFLAMRLPKNEFIGTGAWLFFLINLFKIPFQYFVWKNIHIQSLSVDLWLLPGLIAGLFCGVWMVKKLNENHFRTLILVLTGLGAMFIFFK